MINYYRILGLDNYASLGAIKDAYRAKMKLYHPDLNPTKKAEEVSQLLNEAKSALDTAAKKDTYDRKLRYAYNVKTAHKRQYSRPKVRTQSDIQKSRREMKERQRIFESRQYAKSLKQLSYKSRILILCGILLICFVVMLNNYFATLNGYQYLWYGLGVIAVWTTLGGAVNEVYKHYYFLSMRKVVKLNYEVLIGWGLVLGVILLPLIPAGINNARKSYLLKHNYDYAIATFDYYKETPTAMAVRYYSYTVDGKEYKKECDKTYHTTVNGLTVVLDHMVVKYAKPSPLISEITPYYKLSDIPKDL